MAALQEAYGGIGNQLLDTTPVSYFTGRSSDVKDNLLYNASDDVSFYSQLFDYARDQSVPILSRAMTYYTRDNQSTLPNVVGKIMEDGEEYAKYLAGYTWGSDSITRPLLLELGADTTEVDNFLSDTEYDRDLYRDQLPGLIDPAILSSFLLQFLDAATFHTYTTADHLAGYWQHMESDGNFVGVFMPYISENGAMAPVFRSALQQYTPDDTLGAFLDYFPPMRDLLRSTNTADNLLHLLLEDTAFSIDNIYALQYDAYGDDLVVAASVAAQTGNNMATLTSTVSNLGGSYLTIIDTIEKMVIGEQEMQLSEHHLYGSRRLGIKNYLPRQVYAYWNNTDIIPVADTGSLLSRRPWYSLEYNDVINGLALSPYGSTDRTTSGSQHLAGQRQYEMTNHLGNVLATLSDLPYKSEGEVLQFRVNPALRAVYDYYPFGSLKPGRYVSDTTENCVTMTQSRWVVKYRDSTVWNTGWVSAPATKPNLGIAQQITLSSIPGNGISIEIEDTAAVGGLMTAVQELSVTPNVRQDLELNLQVVSGTFVLRVLEEVNGTDVLLGSLTVSDAGGSDGTVSAPVSYSISILPSTSNVKLQVSSPITMGTVWCCAPRVMNGYWKKITVPYLEQENIVVTLCDSVGDKYRFGWNTHEKINEIAGIGNHTTAFLGEFDTRLGRRWNLDPKSGLMPNESPYAVNHGNPIAYKDPKGDFGFIGAAIGAGIGGLASLTTSVINDGWGSLKDGKTWAKAGVNAAAGAIVGATGGLGAGLAATATTSFGVSLAEDAIDGKELNIKKATASSIANTVLFGVGKFGADKLSKAVTRHWWRRGNTNAFMRYLGKAPGTNVGQVIDRASDVIGVGFGLSMDEFFPDKEKTPTMELEGVIIYGEKDEKDNFKASPDSIESANKEIQRQQQRAVEEYNNSQDNSENKE